MMTETNPKSEIRNPKSESIVVPQRANWKQRLAARAIYILVRLVTGSVRCRLRDDSGLFTKPRTGAVIVCFWHNRLAMCIRVRATYVSNRTNGKEMAALVSASRDGGLMSRVLELFNIQAVRGSSSRRGSGAARAGRMGRARLRLEHHAGWAARSALSSAGWCDVTRPAHRFADPADGIQLELENLLEKLGPLSNPAAVRPLRSPRGAADFRASRGDRQRARRVAPGTPTAAEGNHTRLERLQ